MVHTGVIPTPALPRLLCLPLLTSVFTKLLSLGQLAQNENHCHL